MAPRKRAHFCALTFNEKEITDLFRNDIGHENVKYFHLIGGQDAAGFTDNSQNQYGTNINETQQVLELGNGHCARRRVRAINESRTR